MTRVMLQDLPRLGEFDVDNAGNSRHLLTVADGLLRECRELTRLLLSVDYLYRSADGALLWDLGGRLEQFLGIDLASGSDLEE